MTKITALGKQKTTPKLRSVLYDILSRGEVQDYSRMVTGLDKEFFSASYLPDIY